jgi:hypothetical protein
MASRIYKSLFNLSEDIEIYILEFCIDKRLNWEKVSQQFFKGGFYRNNLNAQRYLKDQKSLCKKFWMGSRRELWDVWNHQTGMNEATKFKYKSIWDHKKCEALVEFTTTNGRIVQKWTGRTPVSKWLKCIKKFETSQPMLASQYLCKKRKFGVKGVSPFYVKKREIVERKKHRQLLNKNAKLFWHERRAIKLAEQISNHGFTRNQTVLLSFSSSNWQGLKFFKGICTFHIYQHGGSPRGKNRFNPAIVDNCFNSFQINVEFSDGETRIYFPEKLLTRIQNSKCEFEEQIKLTERLQCVNQVVTNEIIKYFQPVSHVWQSQPIYIHANTFTKKILAQTYFIITVNKVKNVLFNENGNLIGIYNNGLIQTCMDQYKITAEPVWEDGYITLDSNTATTTISGITYFKIHYGGFDEVLISMSGEVAGVLQNGQIMEIE